MTRRTGVASVNDCHCMQSPLVQTSVVSASVESGQAVTTLCVASTSAALAGISSVSSADEGTPRRTSSWPAMLSHG